MNNKIETLCAPAKAKANMNKPIYSFNTELHCGVIQYNHKTYYLDIEDRDAIINYKKKFMFQEETDIYPSYLYNTSRINYLQFIFGFKEINIEYIFKNNNKLDLRKSNVICQHHYSAKISAEYDVIEYIPGHYAKHGSEPYFMKNPLWKITEHDCIYILMYCEKDTICKLSLESYKIIGDFEKTHNAGNKITWHKHINGYILSSYRSLFLHQIIMDCHGHGHGKGTKEISVDHIDRNPLNNTLANLRLATRTEQEQNSKGITTGTKRARKQSAKPLPPGLIQSMLQKYVVYYHEWLDPEKTRSREFFKIEKHPKLEKIWVGSKSNKIPILEKLKVVNMTVDELDKLI